LRYSGSSTSTTYANYELETAKDGLETTVVRLQYFGIPMDAEDADAFAAGFLFQTEAEFKAKLEQLKQLQGA
jgi:hypothetical protein